MLTWLIVYVNDNLHVFHDHAAKRHREKLEEELDEGMLVQEDYSSRTHHNFYPVYNI